MIGAMSNRSLAALLGICVGIAWFVGLSSAGRAEPIAAKILFGKAKTPSPVAARAVGKYNRGCLAGGKMLPADGPAWQAVRLSRNRNWGHPQLVRYVEQLAIDAKEKDGWTGLLVGDLAQPRGGPMLTGHRSHQIGLDADIWLRIMPERRLTSAEREEFSAISMLGPDKLTVDSKKWTKAHVSLLRRAASYSEVARIFVHPAIKQALCDDAGKDRDWLRRIRPWWGHHYHFHVRIKCPAGSVGCVNQPSPPPGDGCGKELQSWLKLLARPKVVPKTPRIKRKPRPPVTMADLPRECTQVLGQVFIAAAASGVPLPVRKPKRVMASANR